MGELRCIDFTNKATLFEKERQITDSYYILYGLYVYKIASAYPYNCWFLASLCYHSPEKYQHFCLSLLP